MVRNYKKKTQRVSIDEEDIKKAVSDVLKKIETPTSASLKYNIKRTTLNSRLKKKISSIDPLALDGSDSGNELSENELSFKSGSKYAVWQVFTACQENQIASYMKKCSKLQYGLSYQAARSFAYEFAIKNNISHPPSWDTHNKAGIDWLQGFIKRNPSLALRKAEKTSVARLRGFNRSAVNDFFSNLKKCLDKFSFTANKIYNLDETGVSTVVDPPKVNSNKFCDLVLLKLFLLLLDYCRKRAA